VRVPALTKILTPTKLADLQEEATRCNIPGGFFTSGVEQRQRYWIAAKDGHVIGELIVSHAPNTLIMSGRATTGYKGGDRGNGLETVVSQVMPVNARALNHVRVPVVVDIVLTLVFVVSLT
jgi:hypothetical protein